MNEKTLKEIKTFKEFIQLTNSIRLYYEVRTYDGTKKDRVGFEFIALVCTGWVCDGKNEYSFSPESNVEVIIKGTALFDGIRHLYYGSEETDNYGYHYYPNLLDIIGVLKELRKLEELYCNEYEIEQT